MPLPQEEYENFKNKLLDVFQMCVRGNQECSWDVSAVAGSSAVEAANTLLALEKQADNAIDSDLYSTLKEGLEKVFDMAVRGNQEAEWKASAACGRTACAAARAMAALDNAWQ